MYPTYFFVHQDIKSNSSFPYQSDPMRVIYRACLLFLVACATRLSVSTVSAGSEDHILKEFESDPSKIMSLMQNADFMKLFQGGKMQGYMKAMMTGGEDALREEIKKDPEATEFLNQLKSLLSDHVEL